MTIADLPLTNREWDLMDYANDRRLALEFRHRATMHARQGYDASLAIKYAREYAAEARKTWNRITSTQP